MAGNMVNIKVCSSFKLHSGLTRKHHTFCHYSYNLPLALKSYENLDLNQLIELPLSLFSLYFVRILP